MVFFRLFVFGLWLLDKGQQPKTKNKNLYHPLVVFTNAKAVFTFSVRAA